MAVGLTSISSTRDNYPVITPIDVNIIMMFITMLAAAAAAAAAAATMIMMHCGASSRYKLYNYGTKQLFSYSQHAM